MAGALPAISSAITKGLSTTPMLSHVLFYMYNHRKNGGGRVGSLGATAGKSNDPELQQLLLGQYRARPATDAIKN